MRRTCSLWLPAYFILWILAVSTANAATDIRNAETVTLDNGLTVILLEDRNFPVVSVQMLYKVGAKHEALGKTGLAHFLEHMAFRSSEHFPDTDAVGAIYAIGGEWHGYTWTEQTTYFSTVPKANLGLLLEIEADRMHRLTLDPAMMEAERGAMLAELHMYENYPTARLLDMLMLASFTVHPYRHNTIGWPADIENLRYEDVVDFYEAHYHAGNAVLAIVGDFERGEVLARVEALFGDLPGGEPSAISSGPEPLQQGERRVRVAGNLGDKRFMIAYRAPGASHPDFTAFLVLQEWLATGSGVNFLQNDWGTPVGDDALLADTGASLTSWFPPSADDYVFVIGGMPAEDVAEPALEAAIEGRVAVARDNLPDARVLDRARQAVLDALVFDVGTTEDAAHQLAYFEGLGALDTLLTLPERVQRVRAEDVRRVARAWLTPERRTIAWYDPGMAVTAVTPPPVPGAIAMSPPAPIDRTPVPAAKLGRLSGGIPALVQVSDLSPAVHVEALVQNPGATAPVAGHAAAGTTARASDAAGAISSAKEGLAAAAAVQPGDASDDPETRLLQTFAALMRRGMPGGPSPVAVALSGDVTVDDAFALLDDAFGTLAPANVPYPAAPRIEPGERVIGIGKPVAQAQLGYIVSAPGPGEAAHDAWRILRYILSHDYEGRFGKEAISNRGLAYWVDSRYRSDGTNGWVTLAVGVDPDKLEALKALFSGVLARLVDEPPTAAEIDEAKAHFTGRAVSAAQSNPEITERLLRDWLWYGQIVSAEDVGKRLAGVTREQVLAAIPAFTDGLTIVVQE